MNSADEGTSAESKLDVSTPADAGRSLCAILTSGKIEQMDQIISLDAQLANCHFTHRVMECGGPSVWRSGKASSSGCDLSALWKKTYPSDCTEAKVREDWGRFAKQLAKSKTTCTVERPLDQTAAERTKRLSEGHKAHVDVVIYPDVRDTVTVAKQPDGRWQIDPDLGNNHGVLLGAWFRALDDAATGFGKK